MIDIRPVTRDRWPDLERLFESRGTLRGCWCMIFRAGPDGEIPAASGAERKWAMRGLINAGIPVVLLGYSNGTPVAWCSLGPRRSFRGLAVVGEQSDPMWSVTCFYVRREFRRRGVMQAMLKAAIAETRKAGAAAPLSAILRLPKTGIRIPKMGNTAARRSSRPARRKAAATLAAAPTSLADALFTTTQQRVLALLFGQPARSFYASELIQRTGSGSGAVQRELERLASSGLVTVKRIGNQKHYQANPDSPVFEELRGLVIKTVALAEPLRAALTPLADRINLALLYGSVPKGTDTATSDIDILVVADGVTLEDLYAALAPVEADLDRKVSPTLYTLREFADRKASGNRFLSRVLSGEHLVLMGNEHESSAA